MIEINECKCGGDPEEICDDGPLSKPYYVECSDCPSQTTYFADEVEAIETWNRMNAKPVSDEEPDKCSCGGYTYYIHFDIFHQVYCTKCQNKTLPYLNKATATRVWNAMQAAAKASK